MYARLVSVEVRPDRVDECIAVFREKNARALAEQAGFRHVYYFMNRRTGKVTSVTFWNTEADEKASRANIPRLIDNMGDLLAADEVHQETLEVVHEYP
jgi:heme-degrading monooxygenase HmoA